MRILFVYPEIPDTFWNLKHALKFISRKAVLPPLGALTVAAMLPKEWDKKLIDMTVEPLRDEDIAWADYVFISGMHIQKKSAEKVIARCKKLGVKVVGGGILFTGTPEYFDDVDHLVLNEAEVTLPLFLEDLKNGSTKRIYKTELYADIRDTPIPLWELIDIKKYASMSIQYSRGCPFSCDFCNVTSLFGRKMRTKTKEQILKELDRLYSIGWRSDVFFVDDNFIGNKTELKKEILPAMVEWMEKRNYPFFFNTQVSINLADDEELMYLMVKAGFWSVFIGIETPDKEALIECRKFQNIGRDMIACVKEIQRFGLEVRGGFILGFDSDRPNIFESLIKFIQESGIVVAMVGLLDVPRGTRLYNRLSAEGRLLEDSTGDNTDFTINFIPKMNYNKLLAGYKMVIDKIYSPKYYYQRVMTLLKNYEPLQTKQNSKLDIEGLKIFLKSVWFLGMRQNGRIRYWKLILWCLFKRPQNFELAVILTVYGVHFRKYFGVAQHDWEKNF
jgi:radical SAM superfamily enzyme YgiQ (UPF0313 family)